MAHRSQQEQAESPRRAAQGAYPVRQSAERSEAAQLMQLLRDEVTSHPLRTVGLAALAGFALSSRMLRALAGWAGVRMAWDVLLAIAREREDSGAGS